MDSALAKVNTSLSERYLTICENCHWEKQFWGTATEARKSALDAGWQFRSSPDHYNPSKEIALCPHCQLLCR